ncbi:MAG: HDIG domain-containing protein [Syntrophales bacterium]|jgi:putative nucleotidyltransferase with HDIG domain|nr:HDIG domain-containing protein [Syntrophales bacterium]MCK9528228.1 HDIG domain-containing protein [Syntrophales bacterium]MDX9921376.1 HDIG domain-containing protein [Syntrophales bacterium]
MVSVPWKKQKNPNAKTSPFWPAASMPFFPDNGKLVMTGILVAACLFFGWALSPHPSQRIPSYSVGSIAAKDIKADRDLLVQDTAATEQKRQEASRETPAVYEYDSELPRLIASALRETFIAAAELSPGPADENEESTTGPPCPEALRNLFVSRLGVSPSDMDLAVLSEQAFDLRVADAVALLVRSLYDNRLISEETPSYGDTPNTAVLIYDAASDGEFTAIDPVEINTLEEARYFMSTAGFDMLQEEDTALRNASVALAEKIIRPNLVYSRSATEQKRKQIVDDVKPAFYKVQKNEMIVREGQKITGSDVDKLRAFSAMRDGHPLGRLSIFMGTVLLIAILALALFRLSIQHLQGTPGLTKNVLFLALVAVLQVALLKAGIFVCEAVDLSFPGLNNPFVFAIPFAAGAMLVSVLLGSREAGLTFAVFLSFLTTFLFQDKAAFFIYSFSGSVAASYAIVHCKKRSDFFKTGLLVGAVNVLVALGLIMLSGTLLIPKTAVTLVMALSGGLIAGIVVSGTVPLFEYLFGYTTDIRLLELANLNQPIFQDMIMTAPGTYHHAIIVASMVEAAAEEIGANSLLAKVGAYYHDIGKMKKPLYYVENQQNWENKHDKLKPSMSSRVIISHVKDGCDMANALKLGEELRDIIRQHHGTRLAAFFYEKAKKERDPSQPPILESDFRYPGPKPQSKEAALVLLADIVEASSRILKNPTPSRIRTLVDARIRETVDDNQLDESSLTFSDLNKIAESYARILIGIFHHRIEYSESDGKEVPHVKKNGSPRRKSPAKSPPKASVDKTVALPPAGTS